jgi:hypothetical protein
MGPAQQPGQPQFPPERQPPSQRASEFTRGVIAFGVTMILGLALFFVVLVPLANSHTPGVGAGSDTPVPSTPTPGGTSASSGAKCGFSLPLSFPLSRPLCRPVCPSRRTPGSWFASSNAATMVSCACRCTVPPPLRRWSHEVWVCSGLTRQPLLTRR